VVLSLIELREMFVKAPLSPMNPQNQLLGAKQQVYLESAASAANTGLHVLPARALP
jgi:hypothetical protein